MDISLENGLQAIFFFFFKCHFDEFWVKIPLVLKKENSKKKNNSKV